MECKVSSPYDRLKIGFPRRPSYAFCDEKKPPDDHIMGINSCRLILSNAEYYPLVCNVDVKRNAMTVAYLARLVPFRCGSQRVEDVMSRHAPVH